MTSIEELNQREKEELQLVREKYERLRRRVAALVEALERIANMDSMSYHSLESAKITARAALAAHRKGGDV